MYEDIQLADTLIAELVLLRQAVATIAKPIGEHIAEYKFMGLASMHREQLIEWHNDEIVQRAISYAKGVDNTL